MGGQIPTIGSGWLISGRAAWPGLGICSPFSSAWNGEETVVYHRISMPTTIEVETPKCQKQAGLLQQFCPPDSHDHHSYCLRAVSTESCLPSWITPRLLVLLAAPAIWMILTLLVIQRPPRRWHHRLRHLLASPDKKGLLFGSIVEEKKARVSRQLGSIQTERNGGIASPASTRKERRNTITLVGRPPSSIICGRSTISRFLGGKRSGGK